MVDNSGLRGIIMNCTIGISRLSMKHEVYTVYWVLNLFWSVVRVPCIMGLTAFQAQCGGHDVM